jgi:hypothetical protein
VSTADAKLSDKSCESGNVLAVCVFFLLCTFQSSVYFQWRWMLRESFDDETLGFLAALKHSRAYGEIWSYYLWVNLTRPINSPSISDHTLMTDQTISN